MDARSAASRLSFNSSPPSWARSTLHGDGYAAVTYVSMCADPPKPTITWAVVAHEICRLWVAALTATRPAFCW